MGNLVSFIGDNHINYESVGVGLFKIPSLTDVFALLPIDSLSSSIYPMHIISSITNGPHQSLDPWVVPSPIEVDRYGEHMLLLAKDITSLIVSSKPPGAG